jgi:hypothetical protein
MENIRLARELLHMRTTDEEFLRAQLLHYPTPFCWPLVVKWMILLAERAIYAGPDGCPWCLNWGFDWDDVRTMVPWKAVAKINKTLIEWS